MSRKIGVVFSSLLTAIQMLSTLLFTPFLIRSFGPAEYGVYSLALSLTTYLLLLDLGVGNALIRYITKYRVTNDTVSSSKLKGTLILFYASTGILSFLIGCVLVACFGTFFSQGLTPQEIVLGRKILFVTIINIAVTLAFTPYNKILLAYEHFGLVKLLEIGKTLLQVGISCLVLLRCGRSIAISAVHLLTTIVLQVATMIISNRLVPIKPVFFTRDISFIKEITVYTSFLFIQMVAAQINNMTDHVLLGVFATSTTVAVYQVGTQIVQYFQTVAHSFNGVLQPGVVRLVETTAAERQTIHHEMERISHLVFSVLSIVYVVFLINGPCFIRLWVGDTYQSAYYVTAILLTPLTFVLPQNVGMQVLYAIDKHKVQALIKIVVACLNILLTTVLIRVMDPLIGAAIGTAFSCIMGDFIIMNITFKRELAINPISYFCSMLKGTVLCLAAILAIGFVMNTVLPPQSWFGMLSSCALLVTLYALFMWKIGFNSQEKEMAAGIVRKLIRRS